MSSKKTHDLLPVDGLPQPTSADLEALRHASAPRENLLERVNDPAFPELFGEPQPRRPRPTAEGWEPFRL